MRLVGDVGTSRLHLVRLVWVGCTETMLVLVSEVEFVKGVPCLRLRLHVALGAGGSVGLDNAERGATKPFCSAPATAKRSLW